MKKITTLLLLALATTNTLFSAGALTQASQTVDGKTYTLSWKSTEAISKGELNTEKKTITVPAFVETVIDREFSNKKRLLLTITYADDTKQNNAVRVAQLLADNVDKITSEGSHLGLTSREGANYYFRADDLRNVTTADMNKHNSDSDIFYQVLFEDEKPVVKVAKKKTVKPSTKPATVVSAPRPALFPWFTKHYAAQRTVLPQQVAVTKVVTKKEVAPKAAVKEKTAPKVQKPTDRIVNNLQYTNSESSYWVEKKYSEESSIHCITIELITNNDRVEDRFEKIIEFQVLNIPRDTGKSDEEKLKLAEKTIQLLEETLADKEHSRVYTKRVDERGFALDEPVAKPFFIRIPSRDNKEFLELQAPSELKNPLYRNYLKELIKATIRWKPLPDTE